MTLIKALIQTHYPQRGDNIKIMVNDLIENGFKSEDIIVMRDYPRKYGFSSKEMVSEVPMPINWWHGVASVLDCDYVALLCDDLTLKPKSIELLRDAAWENSDIDVFGFEGGNFANTSNPYTDEKSHIVQSFEKADYVIRFYFAKPQAFAKTLELHHKLPLTLRGHDDITLSLANKCGLVPTTEDSGWIELSEHGVAYSKRPEHYIERNALINLVRS